MTFDDGEDNDTPRQPPGALLALPDELAEWADQNRELVRRVQLALSDTYTHLSEDQIWEAIADASSAEWRMARDTLRTAEAQWADLQKPENTALGLIGQALDSDEIDGVREHVSLSLSHFTIINEGLRQRPDLANLLNVLTVQRRMIDQSAERTRQMQRAAAELAEMVSLREDFHRAARKPSKLKKHFKEYTRKLLNPKKPKPLNGVTVPWLPET